MIHDWPNQRSDTWRLRWAVGRLQALPPDAMPSRPILDALCEGWHMSGEGAPSRESLMNVAHYARLSDGPILQYGSGVTTALLAAAVMPRPVPLWVAEPVWARYLHASRVLSALGLTANWCRIRCEREHVVWSDPPLGILPPRFSLAVIECPDDRMRGPEELPLEFRQRLDRDSVIVQVCIPEWGDAPAGRAHAGRRA